MSNQDSTTNAIMCRFCGLPIVAPGVDGAYVCCGMVQGGDPEWMLHPSNAGQHASWEADRLSAERERDRLARVRRYR